MINNIKQEQLKQELNSESYFILMVKSFLKECLPGKLILLLKNAKQKRVFCRGMNRLSLYAKVEKALASRPVVNVAFFVVESSMWKYDELFKLFLNSRAFNPKIILCPYLNYHGSQMERIMDEAESLFISKNYPYIKTWNPVARRFLDVMEIFSPDIIFYCFPYLSSTKENLYGFFHFPHSLTCYVPYSSMICNTKNQFDKEVQNFSWGFFVENDYVKKLVEQYSPTKGVNVVNTGCPTLDVYRRKDYKPCDVWKHSQAIKIIWAPHYTIMEGVVGIAFATFLHYCGDMLELAKKYSENVQIAFKPHPFLYPTLCTYWGKEKADAYYDCWKNMNNTQYETGDYTDLFKTSDAMIFDSVSFIVEYLYTQKPSLFTYKEGVEGQLNEYGLQAFACHSKARNIHDIEYFIQKLLQGEPDEMSEKKAAFYNAYLRLPEGRTASDNIYEYIATKLNKR